MLYLPTGTYVPNVPPRETGETNHQKIHAKFTPKPPCVDGPTGVEGPPGMPPHMPCEFGDIDDGQSFYTPFKAEMLSEPQFVLVKVGPQKARVKYSTRIIYIDPTQIVVPFDHPYLPEVPDDKRLTYEQALQLFCFPDVREILYDDEPEFDTEPSPCIDCGRPVLGQGPLCAECILADTTPLPPAKPPITAISFVPMPGLEFNITITRKGRPAKHYKNASFQSACRVVDLVRWYKSTTRVSDFIPTLAGWVAIFAEVQ